MLRSFTAFGSGTLGLSMKINVCHQKRPAAAPVPWVTPRAGMEGELSPWCARCASSAAQKCFLKQLPGIQPWDRKEGQEKSPSSLLPIDALCNFGVATRCPSNNSALGGLIPALSSRSCWHCGSQGHANIHNTPSAL